MENTGPTANKKGRVGVGIVGRRQLLDVNDIIVCRRWMQPHDLVEFGTRLVKGKANCISFFGVIHPHSFGTAALYIIAASCLLTQ